MATYDLVHFSRRWFLILAAAGTPFVPVFSSGQFVSIRGTKNPLCIQPLKPPSNHRRATVWPRDYAYICIYIYVYGSEPPSPAVVQQRMESREHVQDRRIKD